MAKSNNCPVYLKRIKIKFICIKNIGPGLIMRQVLDMNFYYINQHTFYGQQVEEISIEVVKLRVNLDGTARVTHQIVKANPLIYLMLQVEQTRRFAEQLLMKGALPWSCTLIYNIQILSINNIRKYAEIFLG